MCQAEDDLDDAEREISDLHEELSKLRGTYRDSQEALISVEDLNKLNHSPTCFNKYAGCVCVKRFADYVETPNTKYDDNADYLNKKKRYA